MYRFTYFDTPARGETARLMFALANQPYEDVRVNKATQWAELKNKTQWGVLPVLEVDGATISQSAAINRLLASRFGFAGKDDLEQAQMDMIQGCMEDITWIIRPYFQEHDPDIKAALFRNIEGERLMPALERLEALLVANKRGDGYFVGDSISWADLVFFARMEYVRRPKMAVDYARIPKLTALHARIAQHPRIAAYIAKRDAAAASK